LKVFLDTNIVLDFLERREPHYLAALELINYCKKNNHKLVVAAHSVDNMVYILRKKVPLSTIMTGLKSFFELSDIAPTTKITVLNALDANWPDFEDALQNFCAEACHADALVTRDKTGFTKATLQIVKPTEALALLKKL
jgi:predicted nucleic acid-binding protein